MRCVVCGGPVEASEPVYANAWERARKLFACCSQACGARFDPDKHWIPSARPAAIGPDDEARLVRLGGERLRAGDNAQLVTRDLLVSGVGVLGVRKVLIDADLDAEKADAVAHKITILGFISLAVLGRGPLAERRGKQDRAELRAALASDLEMWAAAFPA